MRLSIIGPSCLVICFAIAPFFLAAEGEPLPADVPQQDRAFYVDLLIEESKLDDGIEDDPDARYAIFVRLRNQLFKRGGDYERFAEKHRGDKRSELRKLVLKTLRDNGESSWAKVKQGVKQLEDDEKITGLERYWIVNGFACLASGKACSALAELDEVEFVYLQKGSGRQHRTARAAPNANRLKQFQQVYEEVLKDWKDDSDDEFSTEGLEIPWNVARIQADQVWEKEKVYGKGVVVGLIDSGLMVTPALTSALWKNPGEELNGKDDDGNGFVDDLFGYDFNADTFYALGDGARMTHGSMCGGIVAGRPLNEKKLATGIAPRARLMILRGMGKLRAYEYALANGADIISMSFMFTQSNLNNYRGVYRLAHEHLAAGGVVAVGGAGNFGPGGRPALPEGRQISIPKDIPCVIAAAGITKSGSAPAFGSRGPCSWSGVKFYDDYPKDKPLEKPDVTGCIGGYPVWGRPITLGGRWKIISKEGDAFALIEGPQGNSFSGPHAAGVAALMLSANPELNVWDVQSLMRKTCKDIGAEGWDTTYGAGLLQALEAVRAAKKAVKR